MSGSLQRTQGVIEGAFYRLPRICIGLKKVLDKGGKVGIIERVEKLKVRWSRG